MILGLTPLTTLRRRRGRRGAVARVTERAAASTLRCGFCETKMRCFYIKKTNKTKFKIICFILF